jgi:hypothetical protein
MVAWKHKNQNSITKWPEYSARAINRRISLRGLSDNSLPRIDLKLSHELKSWLRPQYITFPRDYKNNTITTQNGLHMSLLFLQISGYQIRAASTSFYLPLSSSGWNARSSVWGLATKLAPKASSYRHTASRPSLSLTTMTRPKRKGLRGRNPAVNCWTICF